MQKTVILRTKINPELKEQAESVLKNIGISMETAVNLFLEQIVIQNGMPFDFYVPESKPICCEALSDNEFTSLMNSAEKSYEQGKCVPLSVFENQLSEYISQSES